jgi:hypothetical protein
LAAIGSQDHVEVADVAWLGARVLVALGRRTDATPRLAAALAGYAFHRARIVDPAADTRIRRAQQLLAELDGG